MILVFGETRSRWIFRTTFDFALVHRITIHDFNYRRRRRRFWPTVPEKGTQGKQLSPGGAGKWGDLTVPNQNLSKSHTKIRPNCLNSKKRVLFNRRVILTAASVANLPLQFRCSKKGTVVDCVQTCLFTLTHTHAYSHGARSARDKIPKVGSKIRKKSKKIQKQTIFTSGRYLSPWCDWRLSSVP